MSEQPEFSNNTFLDSNFKVVHTKDIGKLTTYVKIFEELGNWRTFRGLMFGDGISKNRPLIYFCERK